MGDSALPPPLTPLERLRELRDDYRGLITLPRLLMVAGGVIVVVVLVVYLVVSPGAAERPEVAIPFATPLPSTPTPEPTAVVVHAAGAVQSPGVYRMAPGSRVHDLKDAAGGFTSDTDQDRVNLAAFLSDCLWVYFPSLGEEVVPSPLGGNCSSGAGGIGSGPLNLNMATAGQLESLPGVGPATAGAIIEHRDRVGGFKSVDDLLSVAGIGPAKLAALEDLVAV